jgi:hypothetical protein
MVPKTERFELRLEEDTLSRIDNWRSEQADLPSRAEAMRRLVELGLTRNGKRQVRFSDGEKVLILLMRDLYSRLKITDAGLEPDFLAEVIWGGHYWAAEWKLPGVFHGHEDDPKNVSFVVDVLDMWDRIEAGYAQLNKKDRSALEEAAAPFGKNPRFPGFDGNNEAELLGIAGFLVNKLDRFSRFAGRDLNAHMPTIDMHRRMLRVFQPLRSSLIGGEFGLAQLAKLLQAKLHPDHHKSAQ